jgi:tetratricopeptide (TPR) repeat protein
MRIIFAASLIILISSCSQVPEKKQPVVVSLLGKEYFEPVRSEKAQAKLDSNLNVAKTNWEKDPSEENYIWYGRRLAYLLRLQEAVDVFTQGLEKFPNSAKLLRHRGHRFISLRQFDKAIDDLSKANTLSKDLPLDVEPDGSPNRFNIPLSSTQFNVLYHLGLAYYLKGDFAHAKEAYVECIKTCKNDDSLVATIDWFYMATERGGNKDEAKGILNVVTDSMNIIENDSYYRRCQMYQGKMQPELLLQVGAGDSDPDLTMATQGYGVGNWYLYNGDSTKAKEIFEKVVSGKHFSAFGFIASEAELARWK